MKKTQHEFALFCADLSQTAHAKTKTITITEPTMLHRLQHVIRISVGQIITLFDAAVYAECTIESITKKNVQLTYTTLTAHVPVKPYITVLLPLLKKEAFDEALYACQELGVSGLYLITTEKGSRHTLHATELERMQRILHAAAEQSKNFSLCTVLDSKVLTLQELFEKHGPSLTQSQKLFADPEGTSFKDLVKNDTLTASWYTIAIGSEADLTGSEKTLLQAQGFVFCKLGATVLRAQQALNVLIGIVRSFT